MTTTRVLKVAVAIMARVVIPNFQQHLTLRGKIKRVKSLSYKNLDSLKEKA